GGGGPGRGTAQPDHPRRRSPPGARLHAARPPPPRGHVGSRRRGEARARGDGSAAVVLRSLRCGAARGHHARRRHRKGPQDRDRAVRRERGAAHVQALRPRAAGQAAGAGGARRRTPMASALSGKALTVLGAVEGSALGITLPHEHLLIDFAVMFREPTGASEKTLAYQPVSLSNVGWVRQNFNANLDNLRLLDEQIA